MTHAIAGADKAAYLDEWSQPGAMTAMLNWYRASKVIVPAMDETPPRPAFLDAPFPPITQDTLVIWGMRDSALLPVLVDGLPPYVPQLTSRRSTPAISCPGKSPRRVSRRCGAGISDASHTHPRSP